MLNENMHIINETFPLVNWWQGSISKKVKRYTGESEKIRKEISQEERFILKKSFICRKQERPLLSSR